MTKAFYVIGIIGMFFIIITFMGFANTTCSGCFTEDIPVMEWQENISTETEQRVYTFNDGIREWTGVTVPTPLEPEHENFFENMVDWVLPASIEDQVNAGFRLIFSTLTFNAKGVPIWISTLVWLFVLAMIFIMVELFRGV